MKRVAALTWFRLTLAAMLLAPPAGLRAAGVDYLRDVKPLLRELLCLPRSPQTGDLRLDTVAAC
jgi:hypothetical protein